MIRSILGMAVSALLTVPGANVTPQEIVPVMNPNVVSPVARVAEVLPNPKENREMRGVWVTTVINLDFPSRPGLPNSEIKREIDYIVEHTRSLGLNAIFLQVRPAGDAIYPSAIFPWSKYLTGEQGLAPIDDFDPLAYWIDRSHANGIELHAWINPYRVTHGTSRILDVNLLHYTNPARRRPDIVVPHGNALYLDPGFPDARRLIIDGVVELLNNYNLDGIHFDDYFYPARDFNDSTSFALYGLGMDRHQWRVNNVNSLVYGVQQAINEINPNVRFGISPTGIWANVGSHPLGSATRGYQHYIEISADSRRWIQEGWIDYIIPQIYWHIGFDIADYEILLRWWEDAVRGTDVNLYIGHAAWREYEGQANFGGEMLRQLEMNATSDVVKGSVFFRWAHLRGGVGDTLRTWYTGRSVDPILPTPPEPPRQPVVTMNELKVVMPANDVTIGLNATGHNIWGSSIPGLPLYMNGELVTNRTSEGFFSVFASLENGPNIFEFTQPGQPSVTRNISRSAPAAQPAPTPVPGATPAPTIPDRVFSRNEPYYATVTAEVAWLYPRATESGGTNWLLEQGMQDRIIASARNEQWLRLSNGGWISASNVERTGAQSLTENILHEGTFSRDGHIETVSWQISNGSAPPAARATFEDRLLTVYFGMQTEPPQMSHVAPPANSIFENMAYGTTSEGIPYISFRVRENVRLNGYDLTVENNRLQLVAMTPQTLYQNWRMPFYGFTFVVDAGHGGTDYGALGPMGRLMSEKHINLINAVNLANRLESLGAEVVMVRDNNESEHTLLSRVIASRNARPDMFISTHANSVAYTTDATNIRGFTVWYRNYTSHNLARTFLNHMYAVNPDTNRWANVNQANFFVCRPTWAPSILLETSFMSNIDDFAWMINPMYQERLANETVAAIIAYYIQNAG